jgi:hypothetical protein
MDSQIVKKFLAFCGSRRFITVFTTARNWPLSWARCIQSTPSYTTSLRFILIFIIPFMHRYSSGLFPPSLCISHLSNSCYMPHWNHPLWYGHRNNIWPSVTSSHHLHVQHAVVQPDIQVALFVWYLTSAYTVPLINPIPKYLKFILSH